MEVDERAKLKTHHISSLADDRKLFFMNKYEAFEW